MASSLERLDRCIIDSNDSNQESNRASEFPVNGGKACKLFRIWRSFLKSASAKQWRGCELLVVMFADGVLIVGATNVDDAGEWKG